MTLPHQALVQFSSDDSVLRVQDGYWNVQTGKPASRSSAGTVPWLREWGARDRVLSPDGATRADWDDRSGGVTLTETASGRLVRALSSGLDPERVRTAWFHFSRSGRRLAMLATTDDGSTRVRAWEIASGTPILTVDSPRLGVRSAWAPDERRLAVATSGATLREGGGVAMFRLS
jgi:WD40 repeat protein